MKIKDIIIEVSTSWNTPDFTDEDLNAILEAIEYIDVANIIKQEVGVHLSQNQPLDIKMDHLIFKEKAEVI